MAQHDMDIANQGFPATRADLNNALQALVSNSSGATAPSTTFANQWWYDTTNNKMYIRNEANNAWIEVFTLDQTNNEWQLTTGVVQAKDSDGLALKTDDGTTRLFIKDSDGNIGVGTSSPSAKLHVASGGSPSNLELKFDTGSGSTSSNFVDFNHSRSAGNFTFSFAGTERMRILSSGGLTFNGDTAAANALSDYEEGTFSGTIDGSSYSGHYTKIGRMVHISMDITNTTATGNRLASLPFSGRNGVTAPNGTQATKNTRYSLDDMYFAPYNGGSTIYGYSKSGGTQGTVSGGDVALNFVYETDD